MQGKGGVIPSIIDEIHSLNIQGDQMEGESGVTRNIIDQLLSWNIQKIKWKVKVGLL